jgi:molybdopterin-containing oxidoreductase family iron-sulfur binding subunit
MSQDEKKYWRAPEGPGDSQEEFPAGVGIELGRRDFLIASGFSLAGSLLAGCTRLPADKAIPYLVQPEEAVAGQAYWYASTCGGCEARCGALVKCRDGRPIKLEGNPDHPLSRGGLCATGQAMVLGLYDSQRLRQPVLDGKPASWDAVDRAVMTRLAGARRVRLVTHTVTGPAERHWIDRFLARFPEGRHVVYDALSHSAILDAHERTHGVRALPRYRFDQAEVVVAFDADFLGTWISPVEHTAGYAKSRELSSKTRFGWHLQLEPRMTITGGRADRRARLLPEETDPALARLAALLDGQAGPPPAGLAPSVDALLRDAAGRLRAAQGRALVVCGSQSVDDQVLCNEINQRLGGYGTTLDLERPSYQSQGSDRDLETFLKELAAGQVDAVVFRANPVYELPGELAGALDRVPLVVSFAERLDETARLAHAVCPEPHFLEGWSDAEPVAGLVSVVQPTVRPLGSTRAFVETLAAWCGEPRPALDLVREVWRGEIHPRGVGGTGLTGLTFDAFWEATLQNGFAAVAPTVAPPAAVSPAVIGPATAATAATARPPEGTFTLVLYPKIGLLDGRHAHNAWLQELPDPVSKAAWDNYVSLSPAAAAALSVTEGDVIRLTLDGGSLELPAFVQPGQHDRVAAVALGYGRAGTDRFTGTGPRWLFGRRTVEPGETVGRNAAPLLALTAGSLRYSRPGARLSKTGGSRPLASTQLHHTLDVPEGLAAAAGWLGGPRPIVQETVLADWQRDPKAGAPHGEHEAADLWPHEHPTPAHRWALAVDLSACTGCSACAIACQAENNVPVVGKDEVRRQREMHWLRIDRYYSDIPGAPGEVDMVHQPMMCHHCANAACESVCPVMATVHSTEGLNQQIYNRCVGTRYCANNCAYKVRRFNWFDYPREDRLANLALNPDVTVRSRGVMEKCSFCVQRIQEAKMQSKVRGTPLADGEIQPACQQSCPAQAIVFGDLDDPKSRAAALRRDPRGYRVFEELNFQPAVTYLRRVRNRAPEEQRAGERQGEHHG